ncbi:hypothetical protein KSP40_PGU012897 [Platanthera guangdongensis]|uniref:FHA domain-containing protein n=1 Tax=Platanthera guangdongensis TaxID=2320717 RepID=A0ABR2N312_9ASPA
MQQAIVVGNLQGSEKSMPVENVEENGRAPPMGKFVLIDLGFSLGSSSSDRTISRRHISFQFLHTGDDTVDTDDDSARQLLLSFEVIGKNPISVLSKDAERNRVYKKSEKGVLNAGDLISLSIKKPNYFSVKRSEGKNEEVDSSVLDAVKRREKRTRQRRREAEEREKSEEAAGEDDDVVWEGSNAEIGSSDVSEIDPVKEFGFLERGREFDRYPMHKIRHFKDWNWFLEDTRVVSSEDDEEEDETSIIKLKGKNKLHKNIKRGEEDDEEWIVEKEEEGNLAAKAGSAKRSILSTRSKDPKKPRNDVRDSKKAAEKKFNSRGEVVDDEEDETLGGFIVGDDDVEEEEEEEDVLEEESEEDEESDVD